MERTFKKLTHDLVQNNACASESLDLHIRIALLNVRFNVVTLSRTNPQMDQSVN